MKFVSISGPKNDLDRMVNQYLSHYEIQLENALTELRSASKLEPYPGTNPYREPLQKAQKLLASCADQTQALASGDVQRHQAERLPGKALPVPRGKP